VKPKPLAAVVTVSKNDRLQVQQQQQQQQQLLLLLAYYKRLQWEGFAEKEGFKSMMKERVGDEKLIIIGVAVRGINGHIRLCCCCCYYYYQVARVLVARCHIARTAHAYGSVDRRKRHLGRFRRIDTPIKTKFKHLLANKFRYLSIVAATPVKY